MDWFEILLGQIPEAIYFSLFMIIAKDLKEKRILLTILMVVEYLLLKYATNLHYNIYFQILYTFCTYVILKNLYKENTQIVDIFLFTFSTIILGVCSIPLLLVSAHINNIYLCCIISKILVFFVLFMLRHKLNKWYKKICELWNRNDNVKRKIKSLTLRNITIVVFNCTFVLVNIFLILAKQLGGV